MRRRSGTPQSYTTFTKLRYAIALILKYKIKLENLWLKKFHNNRPRRLKAQSIVCASIQLANGAPKIRLDQHGDRKCKPASLTKVLAVMTVLDFVGDIGQHIPITLRDVVPGSGNNLKAGDTLTWKDAFHNMLIASSNTSANAVIRNLGVYLINDHTSKKNVPPGDPSTRGLAAMNAKAQSLGMTNTHFMNASGLDEINMHTSARDMLVMGIAALDYPALTDAWSKTSYKISLQGKCPRELRITSTIKQLIDNNPKICGGKTGTLSDGTQNILVHSKEAHSTQFITILMQRGGDRDQVITKLLAEACSD